MVVFPGQCVYMSTESAGCDTWRTVDRDSASLPMGFDVTVVEEAPSALCGRSEDVFLGSTHSSPISEQPAGVFDGTGYLQPAAVGMDTRWLSPELTDLPADMPFGDPI